MMIQQLFTKGISHSSYLVGGSKTCAVVDPRRDVQVYLDMAKRLGMKITHVLETHLHADFISGHLDLAEKTGADIYVPESGKCKFDHVGVSEGDTIEIENVVLSVLETPGHTPEHVSYVVTDRIRGPDPVGVLCGDTLFVGDVGRPDLFPGRAVILASGLYESLHEKLLRLPDFCEVYPAHGAGSLCGRAMSAKRTSTIGYERKFNTALLVKDKKEFTKLLTTNMPQAPDHFSRCSAVNRDGPTLTKQIPPLEELDPMSLSKKLEGEDSLLLDVRSYESFGGQHIPGSYNIDLEGNFATFAGWVLPPTRGIIVVSEDGKQGEEAAVWLRRVGLDNVTGYMAGGTYGWTNAGYHTDHVIQLSTRALDRMTKGEERIQLVDVRATTEYGNYHLDGSINIPAPEIRTRYSELSRDIPTVLICSTGRRSSMVASLLMQNGFHDVYNAAGGMTGFHAAGYAPVCPICSPPHGPRPLQTETVD